MPRVVLAEHRASLEASHGEEQPLVFITITHESLAEPIRVVNDTGQDSLGNPVKWIYGGEEFVAFPLTIELLTDNDQPPRGQLSIANVDRRIGQAILDLEDAVGLEIVVILPTEFDMTVNPRTEIGTAIPIWSADYLYLRDVEVDAIMVTGVISSVDDTQEPYPAVRTLQSLCPGVYR